VRIKQNIPLLVFALLVAAAVLAVALLQPTDEDRLREAVAREVGAIPSAREHRLHGAVADVVLADGRVLHLEFERKGGAWTRSKELGEEFARVMKDAETGRAFTERLGKRLADRYQMAATVKPGIEFGYVVRRDAEGRLLGACEAKFSIRVGEAQRRGRYAETYRWTGGTWTSEGPGSLFEEIPRK
jgi:hypothetical protein